MSMHDALSAQQFNQNFLEKVASVEGQAALSEAGRQYVKTELQETAFSRAILPQEPVTAADCQRNVNDNSLYLIRDIEPGVSALGVDNLGEPDGTYVRGERYTIPIVNFVTKRFQITVEDLRAYQYKITKRIEDKSVPILEKLEDKMFLRMMGAAALGNTEKHAVGTDVSTITNPNPVKTSNVAINTVDIVQLKNLLQGTGKTAKKLELDKILMTEELFNTVIGIPSYADDFGKDRVLNGITSDTLFGSKIVKTIKSDILPTGHMFAFTTPDFLGHNFAMGEPTFEIKSQFGLIEWQTKESVGMGVGNTNATSLLQLDGAKSPDGVDFTANMLDTAAGANSAVNYYAGFRV